MRIKQYILNIADILYPPECLLCQTTIDQWGGVCSDCFKTYQIITKPMCEICGLPKGGADNFCQPCLDNPSIAQRIRAPFYYNPAIKKLILQFKYGDNLHLASYFAPLMVQAGAEIIKQTDMFIPVPLHWLKRVWRKYNQADVLAQAMAQKTGIPYHNNIIIRQKWLGQKGKNANERINSLKNAFKLRKSQKHTIQGKNITIIDDVITTKATINEMARVLYKNGANSVNALSVARVGRD